MPHTAQIEFSMSISSRISFFLLFFPAYFIDAKNIYIDSYMQKGGGQVGKGDGIEEDNTHVWQKVHKSTLPQWSV